MRTLRLLTNRPLASTNREQALDLPHDRSLVHGSLPNTSPDLRITIYFGFHKLSSIEAIHDPDHIRRRAQVISLCIRERRFSGFYDSETPYGYALADQAPPPASDVETRQVLRTPALGL